MVYPVSSMKHIFSGRIKGHSRGMDIPAGLLPGLAGCFEK
ncbi:MAG: hypothetical protein AVDCRST_MAG56-3686 [uncultured Cytophagales bacterium]|uniref:Uncharacterized protein n=1 Tax=uncultured Cytophagales bacterium TaxID=158755 RepID=A0A6J4JHM7_9SPHI|nr:MAG: hypothetical protein AVDCRST_MAG56-3686 [uncultured Cytophagales bacterium]